MQLSPDVILGTFSGVLGAAFYAISVAIYRKYADRIEAVAVASIKMWIALPFTAVLAFILFYPALPTMSFMTVTLLALSVIFGAVIGDTIYLVSQERIGVSIAFPISMSYPVLTYALTVLFLGEDLIPVRLVGTVVAVSGVIMVSHEQDIGGDEEDSKSYDMLGIGLAFLTSVLYAAGAVILQVGVTDVDPISGNLVRVFFGSIAFIPLFAFARRKGMTTPPKRIVKIIAVAALIGMAIGSILYVNATKLLGAATTSVIVSSAPLFAVPLSVKYLDERVTPLMAAGVILTVLGIALVVLTS
ncbi:MAG: DMT family transporter [Candidatus Thorarchaeota archaeon]|nr:DMT family transporter [Candidatus Thorarchaeota archaeon]